MEAQRLFGAIEAGKVSTVQELLGPDPAQTLARLNITGTGALCAAVEWRKVEMAQFVLSLADHGVVVNVLDDGLENSPLFIATKRGPPAIVRLLLPHIRAPFGSTQAAMALFVEASRAADGLVLEALLAALDPEAAMRLCALDFTNPWIAAHGINPLVRALLRRNSPDALQRFVDLGVRIFTGTKADYLYIKAMIGWADLSMLAWVLQQPRPPVTDGRAREYELLVQGAIAHMANTRLYQMLFEGLVLTEATSREGLLNAIRNRNDDLGVYIVGLPGLDLDTLYNSVADRDARPEDDESPALLWTVATFAYVRRCERTRDALWAAEHRRVRCWTDLRGAWTQVVALAGLPPGVRDDGVVDEDDDAAAGGGSASAVEPPHSRRRVG